MVASNGGARRPARRRLAALVAIAAVGTAACASSSDDGRDSADPPPSTARLPAEPLTTTPATEPAVGTTTSLSEVATTVPPIVTASSTTTTVEKTTTTRATTTSTLVVRAPAPQPIAPPLDEHAAEPVIEVGSIAIPKLSVDMTMYEGIRLTTLDRGPGHWPGSALPGEVGNVVVGGHRVSSHQVFRDVDQLVSGDEIIFSDGDVEHRYLVDRVEIVDPTAIWIVDPTETATATLFACHPPGSTAQRIVVFADLADSSGS